MNDVLHLFSGGNDHFYNRLRVDYLAPLPVGALAVSGHPGSDDLCLFLCAEDRLRTVMHTHAGAAC